MAVASRIPENVLMDAIDAAIDSYPTAIRLSAEQADALETVANVEKSAGFRDYSGGNFDAHRK